MASLVCVFDVSRCSAWSMNIRRYKEGNINLHQKHVCSGFCQC